MSTALNPILTLEDLERMPDDGMHYELLEGELIALPPPILDHGLISRSIFKKLDRFVDKYQLGIVLFEVGFKLFGHSRTWVQPDVSFVAAGRSLDKYRGRYFEGAPDLAVEVYSPSERKRTMLAKIDAMLSAGTKAVVVLYQRQREAHIHRHGAEVRILRETDTLTLPDVLPRWRCKVAKFFED